LKNHFDALSQRTPDEAVEFWFARDLMEPLGLRGLIAQRPVPPG
jgi:hypothetical protein